MPELPEVETVRRSLEPRWLGRRVERVEIHRPDFLRRAPVSGREAALGAGAVAAALERRGKQLVVRFQDERAVLLHLGMSGQVTAVEAGKTPARTDHVHVRWRLDDGTTVLFRDPRRFGGVWAYASFEELVRERWGVLGPDALTVTARQLRTGLGTSTRAIKACLLDQGVLAGVGNIYADESLFVAGIHPEQPARSLGEEDVRRLAGAIRRVLREAVAARGSTLRDFVDASDHPGTQQTRFRVYSRAGQPCRKCGSPLLTSLVSQRTTTHCPLCQPLH